MEPGLKPTGGAVGTGGTIRRGLAEELRLIRQIQGERVVRLRREGCYWALELLAARDETAPSPRSLEL